MEQTAYITIPKGRGLLYACDNQLYPSGAMADNEEAPVSAFWRVFGDVNVVGCWFHYAQAVIKRVQKLGLRDDYA